jgi:1-acyl-sn-glycerol-3-phosphate acyltransferase
LLANLLFGFFRLGLWLLTRRVVEGVEGLPEPPYILASNHLGTLDVPFIYAAAGGPPLVGWAAEKYERQLIFGGLLRAGGAVFIQRGQVDRRALNFAVDALKSGKSFGMAPEGTRSPHHSLIRAKTGVAFLADEAQVPVVPVALTGTEDPFKSWLHLRRPILRARFGPPFRLPPLPAEGRTEALKRNTDEIMCRIAALLPPAYRGVYADHPRTVALIAEGYGQPTSSRPAPRRQSNRVAL